jgi:hypothetical protein
LALTVEEDMPLEPRAGVDVLSGALLLTMPEEVALK